VSHHHELPPHLPSLRTGIVFPGNWQQRRQTISRVEGDEALWRQIHLPCPVLRHRAILHSSVCPTRLILERWSYRPSQTTLTPRQHHPEGRAYGHLPFTPTVDTISSSTPSTRNSAIPLRTLLPSARRSDEHSLLQQEDEKQGSRRPSNDSAGSDFSFFSGTGDLAEELADEEDPLQIGLHPERGRSLDTGNRSTRSAGGSSQAEKTRRPQSAKSSRLERKNINPGIDKEAIHIPDPGPRRISRVERFLAATMSPKDANLANGLVGKPLLYVWYSSRSGSV